VGLGVFFAEDIAHILCGVGEGVSLLVAQRGLRDAADAAYVAGYWAALRAVATSFGLSQTVSPQPPGLVAELTDVVWEEAGR